jgi:hypothetical protein
MMVTLLFAPDRNRSLGRENEMHDSQEHVFTNEFDDLRITISLNMHAADAKVQITMSEANRIWAEVISVFTDNPHHHDVGGLCAFEGGL